MSLFATLLAGPPDSPPDRAVSSVLPWVDQLLVLDSGLSTEHLAAIQSQAGPKFRHVSFPWPQDFAAARNFALDQAAQLGSTWALTIDTDEELHFPGYSSRDELFTALNSDQTIQTWFVPFRGGLYSKERFVRLPSKLRWQGRVHEMLVGTSHSGRVLLPGVFFDEDRKSPDQMARKLRRDRQVLEEQVQAETDDPNAWFYLGMTLAGLGESQPAISAYLRCAELSHWPEQRAWAAFNAASVLFHTGQFDRALTICEFHYQQLPGPELAWVAGSCCYRMRQLSPALEWCRRAIAAASDSAGAIAGRGSPFKYIPAWFEAPHDLMRQVFLALGMPKGAHLAEKAFVQARRSRASLTKQLYADGNSGSKRMLFDLGTRFGEGLGRLAYELNIDDSWEIHAFEPNPACRCPERSEWLKLPITYHASAAWIADGEHEFFQEDTRIADSKSAQATYAQFDGWASCLAGVRTMVPELASRIIVPTVDFARVLLECDPQADIIVKMDIEGAEFAILRHLLATGAIARIRRLYVEWHDRFALGETVETRTALQAEVERAGVEVLPWG